MEELTLKELQEKASEAGFPLEDAQRIMSKSPLISIINSFEQKQKPMAEAIDPGEEKTVAKIHTTKKRAMEQHLARQPRVRILLPLEQGGKKGEVITTYDEQNGTIKQSKVSGDSHPVTLNGFVFNVPKGTYAEVPEQVAKTIEDKFTQESAAGESWKIDRVDPETGRPVGDALV